MDMILQYICAGLTHGASEVVCLEGEEGPTLSKISRSQGTLYQFVKSQPLRSAVPMPAARPSSAAVGCHSTGQAGAEEEGGRTQRPDAHERPVTAIGGAGGSAPVDRVQLYGTGPGVEVQTVNGQPSIQYSKSQRLPLTANGEQYLHIQPAVIHFEGFLNLGQKHFARVEIANVSGTTRRIRVLPAQSRFFVVHFRNDRRLAPGLSTHFQIVFTPLEKRSYYDCIRIKTDDGEREYLLPVHAYPGRRMVLEHLPAPLPPRAHNNWTLVQDVMRLEQFALTSVDQLREGLGKARLKLAETSQASAAVPRAAAGGDAPGVDEAGNDRERKKEQAEEQAYKMAIDEMQEEMQELEKELFLGPGVEMGHPDIFVGDPPAATSGVYVGLRVVKSRAKSAGPACTFGIGGRGPSRRGGDHFQMPFDFPINTHPRGIPSATPEPPWQYVPASAYVPCSTMSPPAKAGRGGGGQLSAGQQQRASLSLSTPQKGAQVDAASSTAPRSPKRR